MKKKTKKAQEEEKTRTIVKELYLMSYKNLIYIYICIKGYNKINSQDSIVEN